MRIAILGATSQIAKDLLISFNSSDKHEFALFARESGVVKDWLIANQLSGKYKEFNYKDFNLNNHFDAIINFVGSGNPTRTASIGADIFDVTFYYDAMALKYIQHKPNCRYLFLSSGAAYGSNFEEPANRNAKAMIAINDLKSHDWYGVAKLYAECVHRAHPDLYIIDIRIFNYFSHTQVIESSFLITDILRAIRDNITLKISASKIVRDFLHPSDFHQLINAILSKKATNSVVDAYSKLPVNKIDLLEAMKSNFGLKYEISELNAGTNATGVKPQYYSMNRRAKDFGYIPTFTSLDGIISEAGLMLANIISDI